MKRLILTSSSGSGLMRSSPADQVILFTFRFVGDRLPSADELAIYVATRSDKNDPVEHWSTFAGRWRDGAKARNHLSLLEFCEPYDIVELWFDPDPNDQLQLIWLLDHFRSDPETAAKLRLRLVDFDLTMMEYDGPEEENVHVVDVTAADRDRKRELAGVSGDNAGSLLRSAAQGFERISTAQAGLNRPARRASFQRNGTRRDGGTASGAHCKRLLRHECAVLSPDTPPEACIQRYGNRFASRGARARSAPGGGGPRRRAARAQ
jgi:hypothetical protein